jgi:hypothetical protein
MELIVWPDLVGTWREVPQHAPAEVAGPAEQQLEGDPVPPSDLGIADAKVPKEVALPQAAARQVARYLADRPEFPVLDVVDALRPLAQPELLAYAEREATVLLEKPSEIETTAVIAPFPKES